MTVHCCPSHPCPICSPRALSYTAGGSPGPLQGYADYNTADWDGYGAEPITSQTLATARTVAAMLARAPDIAPGADGTIGFEWREDQMLMYIDVGPGNQIQIRMRRKSS